MSKWTREEQKKHSAEWARQYKKGQDDERDEIIKLFAEFPATQKTVFKKILAGIICDVAIRIIKAGNK